MPAPTRQTNAAQIVGVQPTDPPSNPIPVIEQNLPLPVQDTGVNTNPAKWLQDHHWDCNEVTIAVNGLPGQQALGVAALGTRRIREITIRHAGTNNTVVTLLIAGGAARLTVDVPAQSTRVWSSEDGRVFAVGEVSAVQTSDVTGGSTFVSASGVEA